MPPSQNTRGAKRQSIASGQTLWQCDFCKRARFFTYDDALEHEAGCEERDSMVQLSHMGGKRLGLILIDDFTREWGECRGSRTVALSENSPLFHLLNVREVANALFAVDDSYWGMDEDENDWDGNDSGSEESGDEASDDESENHSDGSDGEGTDSDRGSDDGSEDGSDSCSDEEGGEIHGNLEKLVHFGRKNLRNILGHSSSCCFSTMNDDAMRAALSGRLRPGDFLRQVEYGSEGSRVIERSTNNRCVDLAAILRERENYPVMVALRRRLVTQRKNGAPSPNRGDPLRGIERLDLGGSALVRGDRWSDIYMGLWQMRSLSRLTLDRTDTGKVGCVALANLLKREGSALKSISLQGNLVDDECVLVLVDALRRNTTLTKLNLARNDGITESGWRSLSNLLCDEGGIQRTYDSNHSLVSLGMEFHSLGQPPSLPPTLRAVFLRIKSMLEFNLVPSRGANAPAERKIWRVHFQDNDFDLRPLLDVDVRIMPHLLAWFARRSTRGEVLRLRRIHRILLGWNAAGLFGFPSAEKVRMGSRTMDLEARNAELEALVRGAEVDNMRLRKENENVMNQIAQLRRENEMLRGANAAQKILPLRRSKRIKIS